MSPNLTVNKTWNTNITFQETEFNDEDSCIVMDQFKGNETKFCLVIKIPGLILIIMREFSSSFYRFFWFLGLENSCNYHLHDMCNLLQYVCISMDNVWKVWEWFYEKIFKQSIDITSYVQSVCRKQHCHAHIYLESPCRFYSPLYCFICFIYKKYAAALECTFDYRIKCGKITNDF